MTTRFYSSVAVTTTLSGTINASTTTIIVASAVGFPPSFPYTLAIGYGTSTNELVQVESAASTTLTVTRAIDGTTGQSHSSGAEVRHVSSARDFTDSRTHENSTTGVHGVSGAVVGTTSTQSLSNKTLTSPTFSGTVAMGSSTVSGTPVFSGIAEFTGNPLFRSGGVGSDVLGTSVTGDAVRRLNINADGSHEWSDGTAAADTNLYRSAANVLKTDDQLSSVGLLSATAGTSTAVIAQASADGTASLGVLVVNPSTTAKRAIDVRLVGDTVSRLRIDQSAGSGSGTIMFGDGTTADTNLYRSAADTLKTDDTFSALIETTTSGLTAATNFTTSSFAARKTCGVATLTMNLAYSGANITSDAAGNITDTLCATIPAGYRPTLSATVVFDKAGVAGGTATVLSDGTITLKTLDPTAVIGAGTSVNLGFTYVL